MEIESVEPDRRRFYDWHKRLCCSTLPFIRLTGNDVSRAKVVMWHVKI